MTTAPADPTTTEAPAPTEPPAAATTPAPDATTPAEPTEAGGDDVPNVIKALRDDFKAERARRQAAEASQQAYLEAMGKALGYTPESAPRDPAELSRELETASAEAKRARVELAIFKAAPAAGGDPVALLDSSSLRATLDSIDPSDADAVAEAIRSAVEANPRLAAVSPEPRPPAPNPAQGASAAGAPDLDQQIAEATKAGDHRRAIALKRQKAYGQRV